MIQAILSALAIPTAVVAAYVTARVARKKEPEDRAFTEAQRRDLETDIASKVVTLLNAQLERALAANALLESEKADLVVEVVAQKKRIRRLETEVVRLGGDPALVNGGG